MKKYTDMNPEERQKSLFTISFAAYVAPCAGLTDTSPASSVPVSCLRKILTDEGCTSSGTVWPQDGYNGWWRQDDGAGNYGVVKSDIKLWATSTDPTRVAGCGRAGPGKVKGWSRTVTGLKNVENVSTPDGCLTEAKKVGSPYWVHRNSTHPNMPNSCALNAWTAVYAGDDSDTVHMSGCTYGGNPETGCTPWPSVQGYPGAGSVNVTPSAEFQTLNPNDCVTKGKEIGALSWGYRTANHGSAPNTCFFYSSFDAGFTGNAEDPAHISGCTNGKSLSNKCV